MDTTSGLVIVVYLFLIYSIISTERKFTRLRRKSLRQERKLDAILKHLGIDWRSDVDANVLETINTGTKIEAVKAYKELSGVTLKEALTYVESVTEGRD